LKRASNARFATGPFFVARLASVLAELYAGSIASINPAGDLVVTIGDFADNGPRWQQLLSVLPLLGHLPIGAIIIKLGTRKIKISKPTARKLEELSSEQRKILMSQAAAAKTDDEAAAIIKGGVEAKPGGNEKPWPEKPGGEHSPADDQGVPKPRSPQVHHPISIKVFRALERHPNLQGKYRPRDGRFRTTALDDHAHRGYQEWHRALDEEVAKWIERNKDATEATFEAWLRGRYRQPDLKWRFPNGI
jgi:hypothetical protein